MEMDFLQLISNVGFPIAMCMLMSFYITQNAKSHKEEINKMSETHKQEINDLAQAVNNNTLVLQKLLDHFDYSEGEN